MSERKNIDRLFQEKFKEFEVNPSDEIWDAIAAKLDEKKKRRIVPFWWKLSGVAALLLIGFLITKSINTNSNQTENPVVNESKSEKTKIEFNNQKKVNGNGNIQIENSVITEKNQIKRNKNASDELNKDNQLGSSENAIVTSSSEERKGIQKTSFSTKIQVSERKPAYNSALKNNVKDSTPIIESVFKNTNNQLVQKTDKQSTLEKDSNDNIQKDQLVENKLNEKIKQETLTTFDKRNINLDDLKGNSISKIETKEIEKKVNDTLQKNSVANNVLEELLNEKESKLKVESKRNRWQLTSNVTPIFLGSVSNDSPIDSTLSNNSKSFNTNVGYGVGVSYSVNKKFSIRSGLNKVSMSYDTNDILFFTGIQAQSLKNITLTDSNKMMHIQSSVANNTNSPSENDMMPFESAFTNKNNGSLRQEMGYLEMPLEMTYTLLSKKFGVKIIGGFSTLFLQENTITVVSDTNSMLLGKANNLNDIHFSTNLGLGVKYSFLKSFEFNIEPTLKYQLNTFNSNAGNFKPYFFGVYTGISYNF